MISAFGVEHGEISKGLPRYLKDIAPNIGAAPARQFRGGQPLSREDYPYLRVRTHQKGKEAARLNAEWKKIPKTLENGNIARSEEKWQETHRAATKGRLGREGARKAIKDNTYTRPKKRLP